MLHLNLRKLCFLFTFLMNACTFMVGGAGPTDTADTADISDSVDTSGSLDTSDTSDTASHDTGALDTGLADGIGGAAPSLTLPFPDGEYWLLTQLYERGSHVDYGFEYGDDSFALDFSQAGCEPYGKPVTPMANGTVLRVTVEGFGDSGYGNSVLVDHGSGYVSRYAHFSENRVSEGELVTTDTVLGLVGDTGYVVGAACPEHPGTHLHVAFYYYGEGVMPEPLSGVSPLVEDCWYNRDGESTCDPIEDDEEEPDEPEPAGELDITLMDVFPKAGSATETNYTWVALVESPGDEPSVSMWLDNDGIVYEFPMSTESTESPWVFTYQKVLEDAEDYPYWITASDGMEADETGAEVMTVGPSTGDYPLYYYHWSFPTEGVIGEELYWHLIFECDDIPEMTLYILNPVDGVIYAFDMDVVENTGVWLGMLAKSMSAETTYTYWAVADNGVSQNSSEIGTLRILE
jgi:hypothetical protein